MPGLQWQRRASRLQEEAFKAPLMGRCLGSLGIDPRGEGALMKPMDAATVSTLSELLDLAEDETVLVTTPDGREFIVAEIDDFDEEIEAVSQNRELMEVLAERSKEKAKGGYPLTEVKKRLG